MKKITLSPVYIVIASALYFLVAYAVLDHNSTFVKIPNARTSHFNSGAWDRNSITMASGETNIIKDNTGTFSSR